MKQVTYGALKKPRSRKEMLEESIVSLGTQSGFFGPFTEQARVLTKNGADKINSELQAMNDEFKFDVEMLLNYCPTLKELIG